MTFSPFDRSINKSKSVSLSTIPTRIREPKEGEKRTYNSKKRLCGLRSTASASCASARSSCSMDAVLMAFWRSSELSVRTSARSVCLRSFSPSLTCSSAMSCACSAASGPQLLPLLPLLLVKEEGVAMLALVLGFFFAFEAPRFAIDLVHIRTRHLFTCSYRNASMLWGYYADRSS